MQTIVIPSFGTRISPRLDYSESLQLIRIDKSKIESRDTIKIITDNRLERINRLIRLKPDVIICDGLTEMCRAELIKNDINIIPWVHGEIEEILNRYLKGKLIKKSTKSLSKNKNISNR